MNERQTLLALHCILPRPWNNLKAVFQDLQHYPLHADTYKLPKNFHSDWAWIQTIDLDRYYTQRSIQTITIFDADYPKKLREIYDPPAVLYVKGNSSLLASSTVAIIGSREATDYSFQCIELIMPAIARLGFTVCSGMAIGADGMAHSSCLKHDVPTIAVLGSGYNYVYPKRHHYLFEHLIQKNLVITEYPPSVRPEPHQFIARNRIISGLSQAIIITEARKKSGTMSTADFALDEGKELFTFPGSIFSSLTEGPHLLIQEGANVIHSVDNFEQSLAELR